MPDQVVYIASPYTHGDPVINVRTSLLAAEALVQAGFLPYAPLLSHLWHLCSPHPYEYWMDLDRRWVARVDAVLRLPGPSTGADVEVALALDLGIPVYEDLHTLIEEMGSHV